MSCAEFEKQWEEWLNGAASPEMERHLEVCNRCRNLAAELPRTSQWVAALREEPREPEPAFWARLEEQLGESQRDADFWAALGWASSRVVLALAVLAFLLAAWLMQAPPRPAVAEFDAPQTYVSAAGAVSVQNGQLNRDQVVLTLVAYREPQR